jgi:HD-GYP domain-containing protein (c-di-GMP phosphodiesterase class II)
MNLDSGVRLERLELLNRVGILLSSEKNTDKLIEMILLEAKALCNADGGTIYLRTDDDLLTFAMVRNDTLDIALGGTTGRAVEIPPLHLFDPDTGAPNERNIATAAALRKTSFNIPDAYSAEGFDFSGTKAFDAGKGYRSMSFLTIPLVNKEDYVIGVLQLINAVDDAGEIVPFSADNQEIVEALASQAAVALDNRILAQQQADLLAAFIKMIAAAIDAKSPYTGGHCERVPILAQMLAQAVVDQEEGPFADFSLNEQEWEELKIASWLHDCGKVTTPVHVMDKATKLETIHDRIHAVKVRFELLKRDAEIRHLKGALSAEALAEEVTALDADCAFLEKANIGGEFLKDEDKERIRQIGRRKVNVQGEVQDILDTDEIENLCISRGTLNNEERVIINGHMVHTLTMLEALPFPRTLRRVPEYAGGHHEKLDGTGYPRGIFAGDLSIPARIMAIADVFEALTAQDRPYKPGKRLSEAVRIMGFMKKDNHLDPQLLDLFIKSGVYRQYAERFLPEELIDDVDEAGVYAMAPKALELPPEAERLQRKESFLEEYQVLLKSASGVVEGRGGALE